jgi:Uma2 family endonuclease
MNVAMQKPWTVERFLDWEARQELRHEFDGVRPEAMTGGTFEHDAIQVNLVRALANRLEGKPCRVHGNSLKIRVMDSIRYPDAFVSCTAMQRGATVVHDPVVIFEILSDSTAHTDRMVKNREYAGTESVRCYVMLEQSSVGGMMFSRGASGGEWVGRILDADAVIAMPEIGVELPIAELYANLDFSATATDASDAG